MIHTVVVSYNRLELLQRTIKSYRETVTLPSSLIVIDNASDEETLEWLRSNCLTWYLPANHYPGYATNLGFRHAPEEATLFHRSDNDMEYLPGWCEEVMERFEDPNLWQLGLRTVEEEGPQPNVGGNCIFRREAWDSGIRYSDEPWTRVPFEDTHMTKHIYHAGKSWGRVQKPCTVHIGLANRDDPYYQETFRVRRISFEQYGL